MCPAGPPRSLRTDGVRPLSRWGLYWICDPTFVRFSSEWKLDRLSLLHGRCVNGPSLFLNAAGSPHNQYNLGLVSLKGLRVVVHWFVTEELLFSTVPNSYIMKVARPLCLRVARSKNSAAVKRFSPALAIWGAGWCCHFVSYSTLTYQMVFFSLLLSAAQLPPLCNLGIGCQFCDHCCNPVGAHIQWVFVHTGFPSQHHLTVGRLGSW